MRADLLFIALLAVTSAALGQVTPKAAPESCKSPGTQLEMNTCAMESFEAADKRMNGLYKRQLDILEEAKTKARLREAQRAWIQFRDKSCEYDVGPREESGSIWPMEHFFCLEYHTLQRVQDLEKYLSCTGGGCMR